MYYITEKLENMEFLSQDWEDETGSATRPMTPELADITKNNYVCSQCWGHLEIFPAGNGFYRVKCAKCLDDTKGFVTKHYADSRRQDSGAELLDAYRSLRGFGINPHEGKSEEELLSELGF